MYMEDFEHISFPDYLNLISTGTLIPKEVARQNFVHGVQGTPGDAVCYEIKDKAGRYLMSVWVLIPSVVADDSNSEAGTSAAAHGTHISEMYWMTLDHGKVPKFSQVTDPKLTVTSMTGLNISVKSFIAGMSQEDSFDRYDYFVSLKNGSNTIHGSNGDDANLEVGKDGKAVVYGGGGDDILHVWHHKTVAFSGGSGSDTISFKQAFGRLETLPTVGATVDLEKGTGTNPWGGAIRLKSVENIVGYYAAANTLTGTDGVNSITSGGYGDKIKALGGNDTVVLDVYFGTGSGIPRHLSADGGTGTDTLEFQSLYGAANTLDLQNQSKNTGTFADSSFKNFEIYRPDGSMGTFTFRGSDKSEKVLRNDSYDSNDVLDGRGGNDLLEGGGGADKLTGGSGADTFQFRFSSDSTSVQQDRITDFSHSQHDHIDLSLMTFGGHLDFIGTKKFTGHAGELHVLTKGDLTVVEVDMDGDKKADFSLALDHHPKLERSDFVL